MTYNEILPLAEVKNYLRVDDDFTEDDDAVERMVRSALQFIEKRTNHIFQLQTAKEYFNSPTKCSDYIDVYDYPFIYSGDVIKLTYANKTRFKADTIILDSVGYASREDVPSDLIDASLIIVDAFYYAAGKQMDYSYIPPIVYQIIGNYRRFTV